MNGSHIVGKMIQGTDYHPSCGCDVPPWEPCACSALLAAPDSGCEHLKADAAQGAADRINAEADAQLALRLSA
jgi:hypothetical protein